MLVEARVMGIPAYRVIVLPGFTLNISSTVFSSTARQSKHYQSTSRHPALCAEVCCLALHSVEWKIEQRWAPRLGNSQIKVLKSGKLEAAAASRFLH
jgi:hypothetical protein